MTSVFRNVVTALKKSFAFKSKNDCTLTLLGDVCGPTERTPQSTIWVDSAEGFFFNVKLSQSQRKWFMFSWCEPNADSCAKRGEKAFWLVHHGIALQNQSARTTYTQASNGADMVPFLQMIVICKLQMNFQILQSSGAGSSGVFRLPIKQQLTTFFYMKARNMRLQIHSKDVLPCNGCGK